MDLIHALVLAVVEGITEFLPVSSTGHMIIASSIMGIEQDDFTKTFTISIQFGAILSVVVLYWRKFLPGADGWSSMVGFYRRLLIAFIPAVIAGLIFKKHIDLLLENVIVVAVMLLLGGIVFLFLDKWFQAAETRGDNELTSDKKSFLIGCFQVIAMAPGVSRSAATIIGGLTQKLNKRAAAEFSFFLAVPTMFAATAKDIFDLYQSGGGFKDGHIGLLIFGNIVAFLVAMLAIRTFITFLTRHGFRVFGYYRIIVGITLLLLYFLGVPLQIT
ncbi:MAG: undecaprenyl-diphosphate phosphatase [Bacteroidota bacterium]